MWNEIILLPTGILYCNYYLGKCIQDKTWLSIVPNIGGKTSGQKLPAKCMISDILTFVIIFQNYMGIAAKSKPFWNYLTNPFLLPVSLVLSHWLSLQGLAITPQLPPGSQEVTLPSTVGANGHRPPYPYFPLPPAKRVSKLGGQLASVCQKCSCRVSEPLGTLLRLDYLSAAGD